LFLVFEYLKILTLEISFEDCTSPPLNLSPNPSPQGRGTGREGNYADGGKLRGMDSPPSEGCPKGGVVGFGENG
jgi:hypothetical protein